MMAVVVVCCDVVVVVRREMRATMLGLCTLYLQWSPSLCRGHKKQHKY
jgi:hypothetical protein